jgi:hypothetical protein
MLLGLNLPIVCVELYLWNEDGVDVMNCVLKRRVASGVPRLYISVVYVDSRGE